MHNLSREFFDEGINNEFPNMATHFQLWLVKYQARIGWDRLFGNDLKRTDRTDFYQIPLDMQMGVLMAFFSDQELQDEKKYFPETEIMSDDEHLAFVKDEVREWFSEIAKLPMYEDRDMLPLVSEAKEDMSDVDD